jgi:hypothetical protein
MIPVNLYSFVYKYRQYRSKYLAKSLMYHLFNLKDICFMSLECLCRWLLSVNVALHCWFFVLLIFSLYLSNENISGLWKNSVILLYLCIFQTNQMDILYIAEYNAAYIERVESVLFPQCIMTHFFHTNWRFDILTKQKTTKFDFWFLYSEAENVAIWVSNAVDKVLMGSWNENETQSDNNVVQCWKFICYIL